MDSYGWTENLSEEQKKLWDKLVAVLKESPLPCNESWRVLSYLSDELNHAGQRFSVLFTMNEIWTRYEQKLAEKTV